MCGRALVNYFVKRVIIYVIVFIVALNLAFILPRLAPGSAASILAGGNKFAPQAAALIANRFGLDKPLYEQYIIYIHNIFSLPPYLGLSFEFYPQTVTSLFFVRFGWTMGLIIASFLLTILMSYLMAAFSSIRRGGKFEFGSLYSSIVFHSIPVYWTAMVFLWVFGVWLNWAPMSGNLAFNPGSGLAYVFSVVRHAILPVLALTLSFNGFTYLLLRGSTQQVMQSDYVLAAKTRGLKDTTVAFSYIVRNSLLPFVSFLAYSIGTLISLDVLIESVFAYPGIGDLLVDAIETRDYPVLDGSFVLIVAFIIIAGLIGDFVLLKLDPRLRK